MYIHFSGQLLKNVRPAKTSGIFFWWVTPRVSYRWNASGGLICEAAALSSNTTTCTPKPVEGTTVEVGWCLGVRVGGMRLSEKKKGGCFCGKLLFEKPFKIVFLGVNCT